MMSVLSVYHLVAHRLHISGPLKGGRLCGPPPIVTSSNYRDEIMTNRKCPVVKSYIGQQKQRANQIKD